jgi:chromatin segregation and condensation protein Rec8/ScpA/Scc1 (kleisin family)
MDERQSAALLELVRSGALTQSQADAFGDIHDRLGNAGLTR